MTKSQRLTDKLGAVVSTVDLDPWGGETSASTNPGVQPQRYTSYQRDSNGGDEAMMRRYESKWTRFSQPDPSDGSYSLADPQSFNRYAYVQNDPVNFVDPSGLMSDYLCQLYGFCSGGGSGANVGWGQREPGFWGPGNLMNRPHEKDWALEDRPVSQRCAPGHICFRVPWGDGRYLPVDLGIPDPFGGFLGDNRGAGPGSGGDAPPEDPCNGSKNWPTKLADMRRIENVTIWKIWPKGTAEGTIKNLPPITYGVVPEGFTQEIPAEGPPPQLVEGKVYQAGGPQISMPWGVMRFTIRDGKAVEVPMKRPN